MASTGPDAPSSAARAASVNQRPQWKRAPGSTADAGRGATAAPRRPSRRERSVASRRWPSAAMAAWLPKVWPPGGVVTRTSGAGRSGIAGHCRIGLAKAVELLQVHEVVDADEEKPVATSQMADEGMAHAAAVELVALDALRGGADGRARLVQEGLEKLGAGIGGARDGGGH